MLCTLSSLAPTPGLAFSPLPGLWTATHQADVILRPQQLHHEVEVLPLLLLLGTLQPTPVIRLVPVELLFPWGFLRWLMAVLSCISTVPSVLQSQDSPMEHCKALSVRAAGKPL